MTNHDTNETNKQASEAETNLGKTGEFLNLFEGPEPEFAEQEAEAAASLREEIYASGPVAPVKRQKRGRGRPTLEAQAREKTRLRVAAWRERQNKPTGIRKQWMDALAALPETERSRLLAKQNEVAELVERMNDVVVGVGFGKGTGVAGQNMYFPDLVFQDALTFLSQPGNELVDSWVPDSVAGALTAEDWATFDDEPYKQFGLRLFLVRLLWREFLANAYCWIETQNPEDVEPGVADEITHLLATMQSIQTPRYLPEPAKFMSERDREEFIRAHENLQDQQARFHNEFVKFQLGQLAGGSEPMSERFEGNYSATAQEETSWQKK